MPNYQNYNGSESPTLDQIHEHFYKLMENDRLKTMDKYHSLTENLQSNDDQYMPGFRVEMKNILNSQYLANMYFGNPSQEATVVFDTGSNWLTVTTELCDSCKSNSFITTKSSTAETSKDPIEQKYGSASLEGLIYYDTVCLHSKQGSMGKDPACLD
jgi:hypothetical protein